MALSCEDSSDSLVEYGLIDMRTRPNDSLGSLSGCRGPGDLEVIGPPDVQGQAVEPRLVPAILPRKTLCCGVVSLRRRLWEKPCLEAIYGKDGDQRGLRLSTAVSVRFAGLPVGCQVSFYCNCDLSLSLYECFVLILRLSSSWARQCT